MIIELIIESVQKKALQSKLPHRHYQEALSETGL